MIKLAVLRSSDTASPARLKATLILLLLTAAMFACNMPDTVGSATRFTSTPQNTGSLPTHTASSISNLTSTDAPTSSPQQHSTPSSRQSQQQQPVQPTQIPPRTPTITVAISTATAIPPTAPAEDLLQGLSSTSSATTAESNFCDPDNTDPHILLAYIPGLSAIVEPESPYYQAGTQGTYGFEYVLWGCNLDSIFGETVRSTVFLPSGSPDSRTYALASNGRLSGWASLPGEPLGAYSFVFETSIGSAELGFTISAPVSPLVRTFCEDLNLPLPPNVDVMLVGFLPNEQVELRRYSSSPPVASNFVSTQLVSVSSSGIGYAALNLSEGEYIVAIGANRVITTNIEGNQIAVSAYDEMECP